MTSVRTEGPAAGATGGPGALGWFLSAQERGNPATRIDNRRPGGEAWTGGNRVRALVDGAHYFARLAEVLGDLGDGDRVYFTDWRGDADERLAEDGPDLGWMLSGLARRGVDVRGLVWRSHSERLAMSAAENRELAREICKAGGEALLDERVRPGGSHHQKMLVVRRSPGAAGGGEGSDVGFVGGIDLCHGRRDDSRHLGDPQSWEMSPRYGPTPAWHDVQLEIAGPAIGDLVHTFRERWEDPTPLSHRNRLRVAAARLSGRTRLASPLSEMRQDPPPAGRHWVQVLRTYPCRDIPYPFAPEGERSVARAYLKAFSKARSLVYVEDQYLWRLGAAEALAEALATQPQLHVIAVLPRHPDIEGRLTRPPALLAQAEALELLARAGGERFAAYDLENTAGWPIYVHAKVCIVDDVWAAVGSANLNIRSWTHDSELSVAVVDEELDGRDPKDPGGRGEGARRFARELRLRLWSEHLGLQPDDPRLLDGAGAMGLWRERAGELEAWHQASGGAPHPAVAVRPHRPERVGAVTRIWARPLLKSVFDPDGRPRAQRHSAAF